eukprot:scaffold662884_cov62-Prasinocladus_malaysianus.AAC.1
MSASPHETMILRYITKPVCRVCMFCLCDQQLVTDDDPKDMPTSQCSSHVWLLDDSENCKDKSHHNGDRN